MLRELVAHLREHRAQLREEWAKRISAAALLTAMSKEDNSPVYSEFLQQRVTAEFPAVVGECQPRGGPGSPPLKERDGPR